MPYIQGKKGRDDLYICPECGAYLDAEAIKLEVLAMLHHSDKTMNMFTVYVECRGCGTDLEADIDARLMLDNEVFSKCEEPEDAK